jgi:DNA-binding GntR family transcriptional regulator
MIEPIPDHTSLHDGVVDAVRNMIFDGELIGGQRVPETLICEKLSIFRTPLREALKVLASECLLTLPLNRGARVNRLKVQDVDDMFPVMGALEALADELVCEKISDAQIDEIRSLHYQMAATKNATLRDLYALLAGCIRMARYRANFSQQRWNQTMAEQEKILGALVARDKVRLTQILRTHLKKHATLLNR